MQSLLKPNRKTTTLKVNFVWMLFDQTWIWLWKSCRDVFHKVNTDSCHKLLLITCGKGKLQYSYMILDRSYKKLVFVWWKIENRFLLSNYSSMIQPFPRSASLHCDKPIEHLIHFLLNNSPFLKLQAKIKLKPEQKCMDTTFKSKKSDCLTLKKWEEIFKIHSNANYNNQRFYYNNNNNYYYHYYYISFYFKYHKFLLYRCWLLAHSMLP